MFQALQNFLKLLDTFYLNFISFKPLCSNFGMSVADITVIVTVNCCHVPLLFDDIC
jgi:hypothetical protein